MEFETKGEIQNIRKDFKAIQILNEWYNSFKPIKDFNKGDEVELVFLEKKVDNKTFKNIKSIKKVEVEPKWTKSINSDYKESNNEIKPLISDTSRNCILMQSVIIYLTNKDIPLKETVKMVRDSFNLI